MRGHRAVPQVLGRDFDFRRDGSGWRRTTDADTGPHLPLPPFGGDEQFANAASCAAVVAALGDSLPVTDSALAAGIATAYLRGRLERCDVGGVEWVFDVGHNPAAAAGLEVSLRRLPAASRTWVVFAAMRDKDLGGVVQPFVATTAGWFVARASADRGATGAPSSARCWSNSARCGLSSLKTSLLPVRPYARRGARRSCRGLRIFPDGRSSDGSASAILRTLPIG